MSYKELASIVKECMEQNSSPEAVIMERNKDKAITDILKILEDASIIMSEVKDELGEKASYKQIYDYLNAPRREINYSYEDKNGEVVTGSFEGDILFDPTGQVPDMGEDTISDGSIMFGDNKYEGETLPNNKDLKFGDDKTIDPWDLMDSTKGVDYSELTFGDKDDPRNKKREDGYIPDVTFGDKKEDDNLVDLIEPTFGAKSTDVIFGDKDDPRNRKGSKEALPNIVFGDDDKGFDTLNFGAPKGFEFGDESTRNQKPSFPNIQNNNNEGPAKVSPIDPSINDEFDDNSDDNDPPSGPKK